MDLSRQLGARASTGTVLIVFFVPSADRDGKAIDHDKWVGKSLEVFGRLFRGATAYPRAKGVWRDDERGGQLVHDEPTIVQCYAEKEALQIGISELKGFLHQVGRETDQGEVGVVIDGQYFGITEFEKA